VIYLYSDDIKHDYIEALKWYKMGAEQGEMNGQRKLGMMYEKGMGVVKNYSEALKWYGKSAEQGDWDAQLKLGEFYYYGKGISKNNLSSYIWYKIVLDKYKRYLQDNIKLKAITGIKVVEKKLTKQQLEKANQIVEEWKPVINKNNYFRGKILCGCGEVM
jgi:uncharacterized protein